MKLDKNKNWYGKLKQHFDLINILVCIYNLLI